VNSKGADLEALSLSRLLVFEVDGRRTKYVIWGIQVNLATTLKPEPHVTARSETSNGSTRARVTTEYLRKSTISLELPSDYAGSED